MRSLLFLFVAVLFGLGIYFARDRVKRALQLGAVLYAIVLVARFLVFGMSDSDTITDVLILVAIFFLVWVVAWAITQLVLRARERKGRSRR